YADPTLCDLISFVVSQDNSCRYCFGAVRSVLRILGHREDFIARLERDFHTLDLSAGDRAALDLARRVSRANPVPGRAALALVAALGDSPSAETIRRMVDDAFASDVLPRRTKALLFAVVARALGSAYVEAEVRALLAAGGDSATELDRILEHLAAPSLDTRE